MLDQIKDLLQVLFYGISNLNISKRLTTLNLSYIICKDSLQKVNDCNNERSRTTESVR